MLGGGELHEDRSGIKKIHMQLCRSRCAHAAAQSPFCQRGAYLASADISCAEVGPHLWEGLVVCHAVCRRVSRRWMVQLHQQRHVLSKRRHALQERMIKILWSSDTIRRQRALVPASGQAVCTVRRTMLLGWLQLHVRRAEHRIHVNTPSTEADAHRDAAAATQHGCDAWLGCYFKYYLARLETR